MRLAGLLPAALGDTGLARARNLARTGGREADDLGDALGCLLAPGTVAVYPAWETLPHERLSPRSDTVGRRLAVLRRLAHPGPEGPPRVVIAPVRAVLQPQLKGLGDLVPIELAIGATADLDG